ncbi:hypothetical protein F503_03617 [Ophiostoma piceae UAMH 11346]|uniref:Uncharacterized protein n=1 Tax=Ophiostoma piceae (strain UAMH 11346) TaxID=1262450 RepID=S3CUY5_OPHP1|nr:hypothetical protein F503_03617 [Ophiostoma piceae UAMH 11346]
MYEYSYSVKFFVGSLSVARSALAGRWPRLQVAARRLDSVSSCLGRSQWHMASPPIASPFSSPPTSTLLITQCAPPGLQLLSLSERAVNEKRRRRGLVSSSGTQTEEGATQPESTSPGRERPERHHQCLPVPPYPVSQSYSTSDVHPKARTETNTAAPSSNTKDRHAGDIYCPVLLKSGQSF